MVGIVIVSHSRKLAEGLRELAGQATSTPVRIVTAAGVAAAEQALGTDALRIQAAIEAACGDDGALVLMDLGSSVLHAEMAVEMLPPELHGKVMLCPAPLVEGTLVAAVEAASGSPLERVCAAAVEGLRPKADLLGHAVAKPPEAAAAASTVPAAAGPQAPPLRVRIGDPHGLHLRPAGRLVTTANRFRAEIGIRNLNNPAAPVNARSLHQVMLLAARQGDELEISASGVDAAAACGAIAELLGGAGQRSTAAAAAAASGATGAPRLDELRGLPASPGTGIGPAVLLRPRLPDPGTLAPESAAAELHRFRGALQRAMQQLEAEAGDASGATAEILRGHLLYLKDPEIVAGTTRRIEDEGLAAAMAWQQVIAQVLAAYEGIGDPYLNSRAADVRDVGRRVLQGLVAADPRPPSLPGPCIVLAQELLLADLSQLDASLVRGIATASGTPSSHAAVIARELGIPMVVGLGAAVLAIPAEAEVGVDGSAGRLWIHPDRQRRRLLERPPASAGGDAAPEPITLDGHRVPVHANIINQATARRAVEQGAGGVGLLRTEYFYLERSAAPSEEEQVRELSAIAAILSGRPFTLRSLDVGGDKALSYRNGADEANPFLGRRGIRWCLAHPDLLGCQLRAILRVAAEQELRLMLPMVSSLAEIRETRKLLAQARVDLQSRGFRSDAALPLGIMVEVPAGAVMADRLATHVDFFSIGTNDLSQYVMAADRGNPGVAGLADPFEPAVLRLIRQTVASAHAAGIPVSVCGRMASDPRAVPLLIGFGVDELSVELGAIAAIRNAVAGLERSDAARLAAAALDLDSAASVKQHLADHAGTVAPAP